MRSLADIYERCNFASKEPAFFEEAINQKVWKDAMEEQIKMIEKNKTWTLVPPNTGRKPIGVKWVYKVKMNPNDTINKHKSQLVVKVYAQLPGVDFGEMFAPVARHETIRLILAMAAQFKWQVMHLDVKFAFLNDILHEEIYVEQPKGFIQKSYHTHVYQLHKALYGLKQALGTWYKKLDEHLLLCGFERSKT